MVHFELLEGNLLGEGSFGKVYKCHWHGSPAAAKLLNVAQTNVSPDTSQEIAAIKKLNNDYVVQFFEAVYHDGKLCLITSYAENGSLYHALDQHLISLAQKPGIIMGVIGGMQYLKSSNIVHRDLKSPNVLLASNWVPKICDFGLAKLKLISTTHIKSSSTVGTTRWMAPELFSIRPRYSFASDVYALGIVIWEIWTERVPYAHITDMDTVRGLIKDGEHEEIPGSIPEHYKHIIKNCWRFEPENRIAVEQIRKVDAGAILRMDTIVEGHIFGKELAASIEALDIGSESTTLKQTSTTLSFTTQYTSTGSETNDYKGILNQYLAQTFGDLASNYHPVLVLDACGTGFTQWLEAQVNQNNDAAATVLGEMLYYGYWGPQDYHAAFKLFSMAATEERSFEIGSKRGNARAQTNLGWMYQNGQGVPQSDDKAIKWYTKAAEQGNAVAQFNLGEMYKYGRCVLQNDSKAVEWYKKAAEQGYANAENNLGLMYQYGRGVLQSDNEAVKWYTKAVEKGHANAQNNLAWMYQEGRGIPQNDHKAVELYTKAAEQDDMYAQNSLGWMYQTGRGVPQSDRKAVEWYKKAVEQNYANAQNNLGLMYQYGRGVSQSDNEAAKWYIKAVEKGYANAQNNLAWMYQEGRGVPQSDYKAVDLYKKAAEQGDMYAQNSLGWMYEIGRGISKDENKAVEWYKKAVEQGYALAQKNLGEMYQYGRGVPKNVYKAVELYKAAAKQGNMEAQNSLNFIYRSGQGV